MADEAPKVEFTVLLRSLTAERFSEVFAASSRKARETYFHRHGVKAPSGGRFAKPGAKNEARTAGLYEVLQQESDDELAEEVLRTYLLTKRPMLAAALDHLGIEHDNGLTESEEIEKFEKLSARDTRQLVEVLEPLASRDDIRLYLEFMGNKAISKTL
jgi:hypothetical protein